MGELLHKQGLDWYADTRPGPAQGSQSSKHLASLLETETRIPIKRFAGVSIAQIDHKIG
jgi:hypothetical protein